MNGCVIEYDFNINNAIEDIVTINPNEYEVCDNEEAIIEAPGGYSNYVWSNGYQGNPLYTDMSGIYSVQMFNDDGCELTSNEVEVIVNPLPNTSNILGDPVVGISTINNYYVQDNIGSTFNWTIENNEGEILNGQGTNNIQVSWNEEGYAIIYVTETNISSGCEFETSITIEVNDYTNIEEINESIFSVFPNPLSQQNTLYINNPEKHNYNINILDTSGKTIYSKKEIESSNFAIPCRQFAKGVYVISINSSLLSEKKVLIIQ